MNSAPPPLTREERLAAKLRENLRRRKAQARGLGPDGGGGDDPSDDPSDDPCDDQGQIAPPLPKSPPAS